MNKPLFSIITICYNSKKTIDRTIKSVLSQTFTDFEYIIVDGASKDNTLEIANSYKAAFGDRLRVSSEPDKGIYDAMNKGIKLSAGNIIGIVNSDDWLEPNALQIVYEAYVKNGRSNKCLYTGGINFHGSNGTKKQLMPDIERLKEKAKMYQMAGIRHPATFVPKEIYNEVGLFDADMHILADTDFILRCYYKKYDFFPINKILSNMADGGISNQLNWKVARKSFRDKRKMLFNFEITPIYRIFLLLHSLAIIVGKRILPKRLSTHT